LEDKGYAVVFQDGHVLIHSEGATQDAAVKLGVGEVMLYRFQGNPVGGSKGIFIVDRCQRQSIGSERLRRLK
jgi:hypothetical protein